MSEVNLRPLEESDAPRLFWLIDHNREQLKKFWWEEQTHSPEDSREFIEAVQREEAENGAPTRGICIDRNLGGVAALHTIDWKKRSALIGYWIDKDLSGHGYTTNAVRLLLHEAFDSLELQEVRITPRATNMGSRTVAEHLGFSLVEISCEPTWKTDEKVETAIYSLSRQDYFSHAATEK